jgi:hypothetical protein
MIVDNHFTRQYNPEDSSENLDLSSTAAPFSIKNRQLVQR